MGQGCEDGHKVATEKYLKLKYRVAAKESLTLTCPRLSLEVWRHCDPCWYNVGSYLSKNRPTQEQYADTQARKIHSLAFYAS